MRRTGRRAGDTLDVLSNGCLFDLDDIPVIGMVLLAVALAVIAVGLVVFGVFVVVPFLLALIDLLVIGIVALVGLLGRLVLRRPWTIEARADDGTVLTWNVVGWRPGRERRDEIAALLASGVVPPDATVVATPTPAGPSTPPPTPPPPEP
jgi:hypothetical protein